MISALFLHCEVRSYILGRMSLDVMCRCEMLGLVPSRDAPSSSTTPRHAMTPPLHNLTYPLQKLKKKFPPTEARRSPCASRAFTFVPCTSSSVLSGRRSEVPSSKVPNGRSRWHGATRTHERNLQLYLQVTEKRLLRANCTFVPEGDVWPGKRCDEGGKPLPPPLHHSVSPRAAGLHKR